MMTVRNNKNNDRFDDDDDDDKVVKLHKERRNCDSFRLYFFFVFSPQKEWLTNWKSKVLGNKKR